MNSELSYADQRTPLGNGHAAASLAGFSLDPSSYHPEVPATSELDLLKQQSLSLDQLAHSIQQNRET